MNDETLEGRVARLERSQRRLRLGVGVALVAGLALFVIGAKDGGGSDEGKFIFAKGISTDGLKVKRIVAEAVTVVDSVDVSAKDINVRARLEAIENGNVSLTLFQKGGNKQVAVFAAEDRVGLVIWDRSAKDGERIIRGAMAVGHPTDLAEVFLTDAKGTKRFSAVALDDGSFVKLLDASERPRAAMTAEPKGAVMIIDGDGDVTASLP